MKYNSVIYKLTLAFSLVILQSGCKKFVDIDPPINQIISQTVFESDQMAISAMSGLYSEMMRSSSGFVSGSPTSITSLTALSSDELNTSSSNFQTFQTNSLLASDLTVKGALWDNGFKLIYYANSILEGLSKSSKITDSISRELEGEAKFVRAFCHFYLLNLFGDIPIVTSTDYRRNNSISRSDAVEVYNQIITDLQEAEAVLRDDFVVSLGERTRPNKWAAKAFLARVYLYNRDWAKAEEYSSSIIENTGQFSLNIDLNTIFLQNSEETIWQLIPVQPGENTNEGQVFIPANTPATEPPYWLTNNLMSAFEDGDIRRVSWIDSTTASTSGTLFFYPYKYKVFQSGMPVTEYYTILRLAEQFLIRAEARTRLNKLTGPNSGESDLNIIRNRAGLAPYTSTTQLDLLTAIEKENRIEFFCELGHRWFDLKRLGTVDLILSTIKAPNWQASDSLYPIPQTDIQNNPHLTQNIGY